MVDEVASAYPDAVRVWELLARVHEARRDYAAAVEAHERVLSAMPDRMASLIAIAQDLVALGRRSEARWFAQQALDYAPDHLVMRDIANETDPAQIDPKRALFRQALARSRLGMNHRAVQILQVVLVDEDDDRVDMRLALARFLLQQGSRVGTADACMKVLDQNPDCLLAHAMLVRVWRAAGSTTLEQYHLSHLKRLDPDHRLVNELMGDASPVPIADVPARQPLVTLPPAPSLPEGWSISAPTPESRSPDDAPLGQHAGSNDFITFDWSPVETDEIEGEARDAATVAEDDPWLSVPFAPSNIAASLQEVATSADGDEEAVAPSIEPMVWLPNDQTEAMPPTANPPADDATLQRYLRQLRKARGKALEALIAELEQLLPHHSADARWHELLGMAYARRGDPLAAIRAFQRAMELESRGD